MIRTIMAILRKLAPAPAQPTEQDKAVAAAAAMRFDARVRTGRWKDR